MRLPRFLTVRRCEVTPTGEKNAKGRPGYKCSRCGKVYHTDAPEKRRRWYCLTEAEEKRLAAVKLWRPGTFLRRAFKWGTVLRFALLVGTFGLIRFAKPEGCQGCTGREAELNRLGALVHWWLFG